MKKKLWRWVTRNIPPGKILPWWALVARAVITPLEYFYWKFSQAYGYQLKTDVWMIGGVPYAGAALRALEQSEGQSFRVGKTESGVVTLTRLD